MRRIALLIVIAVAAFVFASCEEEEVRYYLPDSHWILHADGMVEGHRLALTFTGDELEVSDGSYKTPPFTGSRDWEYYVTDDGYLHIWYTTSDSDGGTSTDSEALRYSISEDGLTLSLVYEPWIGSTKYYTFDRR